MILLVASAGVANACATYWLSHRHISELLDEHLQGAAVWLAAGKVGALGTQGPPQHSIDGFVGQVWKQGISTPTDNTDSDVVFDRNAPEGFSTQIINDRSYRIYTLYKDDGKLTYEVGQPVAYREQTARRAAFESLLPTFILIPLVWFAIPSIVNAAFASLSRAGAQAETVGIGHLRPLDISPVPDEVQPFAESVNRMIARLQAGIDSERRFVADAAHELRTPIAALQLRVDNLANASDDAARTERLSALREAVGRASTMVRQLLALARADAPLDSGTTEAVDVRAVVQTLLADLLPLAAARSIDLGVNHFEPARARAREADLRMAVHNLVENAVRYTPSGGRVDIDVLHGATHVIVRVTDTGPGIPQESLERVFDRFYRLHPGTTDGTGLGLSIVKSVATKFQGAVSLENRIDGQTGLSATIVLPAWTQIATDCAAAAAP